MNSPERESISSRSLVSILSIAFFSLSVAVLVVSNVLLISYVIRTQTNVISNKQQLIAQGARDRLDNYIQEKLTVLITSAWLLNPDGMPPAEKKDILLSLLGLQPAFRKLTMFNEKNLVVAEAARLAPYFATGTVVRDYIPPPSIPAEGHISNVAIDPATSEPIVNLAVNVNDAFGDFRGTLVAELNLKFIWDLVDRLRVGDAGTAYVVDKKGQLIAFSDTGRVLKGERLTHLKLVEAFTQSTSADQQESVHFDKGIMGTAIVGTYVPLKLSELAVVTELPWPEAYREVMQLSAVFIAITLLMAVLAGFVGRSMARKLSVPLINLTRTAERIAGGDKTAQAVVAGPAEIASLSQTFNSMTYQLRKSLDILENQVEEVRRAKESLRISEERLVLALEGSRDGIWDWNLITDEVYFSPQYYTMMGYQPDEFPASYENWRRLVHPEDIGQSENIINKAIEEHTAFATEFRFKSKQGKWRWILGRGKVGEIDQTGKAVRISGSHTDITERKRVEEKLQLTQFTVNNAMDEISWIDSEARIIYMNQAGLQSLGYTSEEILTMSIHDIVPKISKSSWPYRWEELRRKKYYLFESARKRKDGSVYPVEIGVNHIQFGKNEYICAFTRDISDRKQQERERLANLKLLATLDKVNRVMHGTNDMEKMLGDVLDLVLSVFDCNRTYLLYPCDPEAAAWTVLMERCQQGYTGFRKPGLEISMDEEMIRLCRTALSEDTPVQFGPGGPHAFPVKGAKHFGFQSLLIMALHPKIGKPWQFGMHQCDRFRTWTPQEEKLFQEIGRRLDDSLTSMLMYRDLCESEEFLNNIVENIPNMIFVKDARDMKFVRFNKAGEQLLGYSREEMLGKTEYDLFPSGEAHLLAAKDQEILKEKKCVNIPEEPVRTRNNAIRILNTKKIPILNKSGTPQYLLGIAEDITERKQTEGKLEEYRNNLEELVKERTVALEEAKEQAEQASRYKSEFLANMSHELRTPLNAIMGFSQLMARDPMMNPKQKENLKLIHRSGEHLLTLINDVLNMSKIEAGKIELNLRDFDLHELIHGLSELFHGRAVSKGLSFRLDTDTHVPRYVYADESKLRQILINILGNALKFTYSGEIGFNVSADHRQAKGPETLRAIRFVVTDTGPGIPEHMLDDVFHPFMQAETRQNDPKQGTGLGLSISRSFARLMGGDITATSRLGHGSVFIFSVPMCEAINAMSEKSAPAGPVTGLATNAPPPSILVVEDDTDNRLYLEELLTATGFKVRSAINGQEGVEAFSQWSPDLVFMDIRMPVMDGLTAIRTIKATDKGGNTPVIALTAHAFEEERDEILAAGCDDFISKPIDETLLFGVISKHLKVRFTYQAFNNADTSSQENTESLSKMSGLLSALPEDLRREIHDAALELDIVRMNACIDRIKLINDDLAGSLQRLVADFRFDAVLNLL